MHHITFRLILKLPNVTFCLKPFALLLITFDQNPPPSQLQVEEASSSTGLAQHLSQSLLSRCQNWLEYCAKLVLKLGKICVKFV